MSIPSIRTTVVGSYPVPEWLIGMPSQQALIDATQVVFKLQELAGIDVVADDSADCDRVAGEGLFDSVDTQT